MKKDLKEIDRYLNKYFKNLDIPNHELLYFLEKISHHLFTAGERLLKSKDFSISFTEPKCFSLNTNKEPRVSCFSRIQDNHIFFEQTELVSEMLMTDEHLYHEINPHVEFSEISQLEQLLISKPRCGREYNYDKIIEWRSITKKLAEILKINGEVVIDCKYGCWWGRKSCIYLAADEVLAEISANPETLELLDR